MSMSYQELMSFWRFVLVKEVPFAFSSGGNRCNVVVCGVCMIRLGKRMVTSGLSFE